MLPGRLMLTSLVKKKKTQMLLLSKKWREQELEKAEVGVGNQEIEE